MKKTLLYISLILLFASCEKVVVIDLNDSDPRIVVDGRINQGKNALYGEAYVQLHWTASFYETDSINTIKNAQVKITDKQGNVDKLTHIGHGLYFNPNISKGQIGDSFQLEINVDGKTFHSTSTLTRPVPIDSLTATIDNFGPHQGDGYTVNCHFTDPAGETNYYYLKIMIDGVYSPGWYITRDDGLDGKAITYTFFRNLIEEPSNVQVELYTIDEASFEYFKVLTMMNQGGMSTAPGNPPTNIEGGAIGIFSVRNKDVQTISVP